MGAKAISSFSSSRLRFAAALLVLIGFKLWLVHREDIIGSATQYDAFWYIRSAQNWYWFRQYDWTAFIRACGYPLWIALVHLLHLPLRLAIELLQLGGALTLVGGLRAVGVNRWACVAAFAVIGLHPAGFQLNDYSLSDTLYAGLLWYLLGGLLLVYANGRLSVALATGCIMGILWNVREEGLLLVFVFGVWLMIGAVSGSTKTLWLGAATILVAAAVIASAYGMNRYIFKSFARSEMTASQFESLFHGLLRIKPAEPKSFVPITMDTMHRAFAISPTFARLREPIDGRLGEAWRVETFRQTGVRGEIGTGWIVWAISSAAGDVGVFETPDKARKFFRNAGREINAACDDGRLPSRFVIDGFFDPLGQTGGLNRLPRSAWRVGSRLFARWSIKPVADDKILTAAESDLYDTMTLRRSKELRAQEGFSTILENFIGQYHFVFIIGLTLLVLASLPILWSRGLPAGYWPAILFLLSATISRFLLFAWLDATAYDATQDRYLFPVLPIWSLIAILIVAGAMQSHRDARTVTCRRSFL